MLIRELYEQASRANPGMSPNEVLLNLEGIYRELVVEHRAIEREMNLIADGITDEWDRAITDETDDEAIVLDRALTRSRIPFPPDVYEVKCLRYFDADGVELTTLYDTIRYSVHDGYIEFYDSSGLLLTEFPDTLSEIRLAYYAYPREFLHQDINNALDGPEEIHRAVLMRYLADSYAAQGQMAQASYYDGQYRRLKRLAAVHSMRSGETGNYEYIPYSF